MRIGLVTDVHRMPNAPASAAAWHGGGEFEGALDRLREALSLFAERSVDLVLVGGDLAHHGDLDSLADVLAECTEASAPVLVVAGNHDVADDASRLERAARDLVALATPLGELHDAVRVAGVHVGETDGWFGARLRELPQPGDWGDDPVVLLSHYPALSLATLVSEQGFPYPGDLLDRGQLAQRLVGRRAPVVVVGGHVHARAALTDGPVLQLTTGALVEPPFEVAVIEVEPSLSGTLTVRRHSIPLLDVPRARVPIFSPQHEAWRFDGLTWTAQTQPVMTTAQRGDR